MIPLAKSRILIALHLIILMSGLAALLLHTSERAAGSGIGGYFQDESEENDPLGLPRQIPDSSSGLAILAQRCSNCHGQFGLEDGELAADLPNPPAAYASLEFLRSAVPADLYLTLTEGRIDGGMPPFGPTSSNPLSEDQRWNVIAAIYSLGTPLESIERGRQNYEAKCAECHGAQGRGDGPGSGNFENSGLDISTVPYWSNNSNEMIFYDLSGPDFEGAHDFELNDDGLWAAIDYMRTFNYTYVDALASFRPIEDGRINGQVHNGSFDQALTSETAATLRGFTREFQLSVELTGTVRIDGKFDFEVADVPQDLFYRVSVNHGGIDFSSDFGQLSFDNPRLDLPVTVYEKTADSGAISIEQLHVILDFGQDFINISEFYVVSNNEAAVFVGESGQASRGTFQMSIPPGAQNVSFQRGFGSVDSLIPAREVIETGSGWADTFPVQPGSGTLNLLVQFTLPYEDGTSISHLIHYPTSAVNLVIPEAGVDLVTNGDWTDTGVQIMGAGSMATYGQIALPANDELTITLVGAPSSAAPTPASLISGNNTEILVGAAIALAVLFIGAVVIRQWRMTPILAADRQSLIKEIAYLDEAFKAGEIGQENYQRDREGLKADLVAIWSDEAN